MKLGQKRLKELKSKKLKFENLSDRYFINLIGDVEVDNVYELLDRNICTFKELIDKFKTFEVYEKGVKYSRNFRKPKFEKPKFSGLVRLLHSKEIFEKLMTNNKLNHEDLRYLLFKTESYREMGCLTYNRPAFEKILNDFLMNKDVVDKFNKLVENSDWCKHYRMRTIFDDLRYVYQKNDEILELIDVNENFHSLSNFNLTEEQRLDLIEILKDNEFAQDRFNRIVKNHLGSNYNYDELKRHLTKIEKKNLLNI